MDETSELSIELFIGIGLLTAFLSRQIATRKGLSRRGWAATCFLFPLALIVVACAKPQQRTGDTQAFHNPCASLAAYDSEIKAAVEPSHMAYADVHCRSKSYCRQAVRSIVSRSE